MLGEKFATHAAGGELVEQAVFAHIELAKTGQKLMRLPFGNERTNHELPRESAGIAVGRHQFFRFFRALGQQSTLLKQRPQFFSRRQLRCLRHNLLRAAVAPHFTISVILAVICSFRNYFFKRRRLSGSPSEANGERRWAMELHRRPWYFTLALSATIELQFATRRCSTCQK